jgi:hypothetical protein|tara:strand:- start:3193 stop:3342 length:150 start_codon:yes stop_codon:yes gene_type:complete
MGIIIGIGLLVIGYFTMVSWNERVDKSLVTGWLPIIFYASGIILIIKSC